MMEISFDKEKEFEEIQALFETAIKECHMRGIPCFWCAAIKDGTNDTRYVMNGVSPASLGIELKNNKIPQLTMVLRSEHLS